MIEVTIQSAARRRGIKTAYGLQKEFGLSPAVAADLWRGEKLPRLETLERFCVKWNCEVGELVRYVRRNGTKASRSEQS